MDINKKILKLMNERDALLAEGGSADEVDRKIGFAFAVKDGKVSEFRDRLIASEIQKTYSRDAQLAILFNKELNTEEYEAYQAFRTQCKKSADALIENLMSEVGE